MMIVPLPPLYENFATTFFSGRKTMCWSPPPPPVPSAERLFRGLSAQPRGISFATPKGLTKHPGAAPALHHPLAVLTTCDGGKVNLLPT